VFHDAVEQRNIPSDEGIDQGLSAGGSPAENAARWGILMIAPVLEVLAVVDLGGAPAVRLEE
jgi:hypothetical protein